MPRKPRMYLPDVPCHVIQRGNNREASFFTAQDYQFYLECLHDASQRYGVLVHAYVLMTNHVHLLMTPREKHSISSVMQSIGRRYVQYINQTYRCTGTLFSSKLEPHEVTLIRQSATFSMPVGISRFKKQIEKALNRKIGYAQRGRPIKD